jgi:hypothetical protein
MPKAQKYAADVWKETEAAASVLMNFRAEGNAADGADFAVAAGGAIGAGAGAFALATAMGGMGALGTWTIASFSIPVVGIVVGIVALIGGIIASIFTGNRKHEEMKARLRSKLQSEVFPNVIGQITPFVQAAISQKTDEICADIDVKLDERKAALEKALADLRTEKMADEEENKALEARLAADIELAASLAGT